MRSTHARRLVHIKLFGAVVSLSVLFTSGPRLCAARGAEVRREALATLNHLYSLSPAARCLAKSARAVLVFPTVVKIDSRVGTQQGYGTLFVHGRTIGYYKLVTASYSVPKGVQKFGYALFLMSDDDLAKLCTSGGSHFDTGPNAEEENQKCKKQMIASTLVNADPGRLITIAPLPVTIVGHASQITHRPAMNDQQEAAPRPNDQALVPTYRGFVPIPNTDVPRALITGTLRKEAYAFAFAERGLIPGLSLAGGTKIMPIHLD